MRNWERTRVPELSQAVRKAELFFSLIQKSGIRVKRVFRMIWNIKCLMSKSDSDDLNRIPRYLEREEDISKLG